MSEAPYLDLLEVATGGALFAESRLLSFSVATYCAGRTSTVEYKMQGRDPDEVLHTFCEEVKGLGPGPVVLYYSRVLDLVFLDQALRTYYPWGHGAFVFRAREAPLPGHRFL